MRWLISVFDFLPPSRRGRRDEQSPEHGDDITQDTVWTPDDVHLVTANSAVTNGATLTIVRGAIVKFNSGRRLSMSNGTLLAVGTASEKIILTSYKDDSHGGDTNVDGPSAGAPGDWKRIYFNKTASSRLEHAVVSVYRPKFLVICKLSVTTGLLINCMSKCCFKSAHRGSPLQK